MSPDLQNAIYSNNLQEVVRLAEGAPLGEKNEAMHYTAASGSAEIVAILLEKGAQIKSSDSNGINALHFAAKNGHTNVVEILLDHGAQIESSTSNGAKALHFAAEAGHTNVVQILLDKGAQIESNGFCGRKPLHYATTYGGINVVRQLLSNGANVNSIDNGGNTLLIYTVRHGSGCINVVRQLLANGADVNLRNNEDKIALYYAVNNGYAKPAELLSRNMLLNQPKTEKPDYLYGNNSAIWDKEFTRINAYVENEKAGINKTTKQTYLTAMANQGFNTLRYLSFFAQPINHKVSETDNNVSSIPRSFTPG